MPCNDASDCDPGDLSFVGDCVRRNVMDVVEQVCMRSCDVDAPCPAGLDCIDNFCRPPVNASCTTWLAAVNREPCFSDDDCNPLGADAAFYPNACEGEMGPVLPDGGVDAGPLADGAVGTDAGMGTPGTCVQPCSDADDCFDMIGGQTCAAPTFFCLVPPPGT